PTGRSVGNSDEGQRWRPGGTAAHDGLDAAPVYCTHGSYYVRAYGWGAAGHNRAAPRTPLASPWRARTNRVRIRSPAAPHANTYALHSRGTLSYNRARFDIPPPATITSGSMMLM